jgi:Flp pilus assembly protein TadG
MAVPVFMLILLGMLEFGFAFSHHLTMEYATREGARTGAALANGSGTFTCTGVDDDNVDNQIIAAVQRVLTGAGSQIDMNEVGNIRVFKSTNSGNESGGADVWSRGTGGTVDGVRLRFQKTGSGYPCATRVNSAPARPGSYPDSIGVSITYDYQFVTPLGIVMGIGGDASLHMSDKTIMALNPTPQ